MKNTENQFILKPKLCDFFMRMQNRIEKIRDKKKIFFPEWKLLAILCNCIFSPLSASANNEGDLEAFFERFPPPIYQDLVIGEQIHPIGTDECANRYELIRPILDQFEGPFSVLDIGAAQGYFSFRIAREYPQSTCVMIEDNDSTYYTNHGDILSYLYRLNSDLGNIHYLKTRIGIKNLIHIKEQNSFDLIIAFLVMHLMDPNLKPKIEIIQHLLTLGNYVLIETANDVDLLLTTHIDFLSQSHECIFLGEVKRHKDEKSESTGKLFLFKGNPLSKNLLLQNSEEDPSTLLNGILLKQ